jgi:hypothetical protein
MGRITVTLIWPIFFMVALPHELLRTDEVNKGEGQKKTKTLVRNFGLFKYKNGFG